MNFIYHHKRVLDSVVFGEVMASPAFADPDLKAEYSWLEKQVGFYPLFLAVGETEQDICMTGYNNNWRRVISSEIVGRDARGNCIQKNILRAAGEFPNYVLFSFENVEGVFMDYINWHLVLNSSHNNYQMTEYEKRLIFKPSWTKSRWLRKATERPHTVQFVTERLCLPDAGRIWTHNSKTKLRLEKMGFRNVAVKQISVE